MLIERQPVTLLESRVTSLQSKVSAYQSFNTRLSSLADKVNTMLYGSTTAPTVKPSSFADRLAQSVFAKGSATSSNEDVLTAVADGSKASGSYAITVSSLAKAQSYASAQFSSATENHGLTGTISITPGGGAPAMTIDLSQATSLKDLQTAINDYEYTVTENGETKTVKNDSVKASIINDGSGYRLLLTSTKTGTANSFTLDAAGQAALGGGVTQAAADAQLTVNGVAITSDSNTVKDAIDGVTINLKKVSSDPVALDVAVNTDSIVSAIKDMITAYNSANSYINTQFTYNSSTESSGVLAGDATLRSIQSKLQSQVTQSVSNPLSPYRTAGQLGISFNKDGSMTLDEDKLKEALSNDSKGVAAFFLGDENHKSMLTSLGETLSGLTDSLQNPIKSAMDGLNKNIKSIQDSIETYEARLELKEEQLTAQFNAADLALRLMKVNQSSLTSALASLTSSSN